MKVKNLTQENVKLIREDLEKAISEVAAKYGLKASTLGNIGFNYKTMTTSKLTLALEDTQPTADAPMEELLGSRYKMGSRTFTLTSIQGEKFIGVTNRGARYLLSREDLSRMIKL